MGNQGLRLAGIYFILTQRIGRSGQIVLKRRYAGYDRSIASALKAEVACADRFRLLPDSQASGLHQARQCGRSAPDDRITDLSAKQQPRDGDTLELRPVGASAPSAAPFPRMCAMPSDSRMNKKSFSRFISSPLMNPSFIRDPRG
jgi:hypothetical protein